MLTPAQLLLVERLIAILLTLMRAIEQAQAGNPIFRRSAARFALTHILDHLERLRDSNPAPEPIPAAISPTARRRAATYATRPDTTCGPLAASTAPLAFRRKPPLSPQPNHA